MLESRGPEPHDEQRARIRAALLAARARRVRPGLDDKRLAAWNALAIGAFAEAGAVLGRRDYLDAARAGARLRARADAHDGRPAAAHVQRRRGAPERLPRGPRIPARGAARPLRGDVRAAMVHEARGLGDAIARASPTERRRLLLDLRDHEQLVARRKDLEDAPIPPAGRRRPRPAAAGRADRRGALRGRRRRPALRLLHEIAARHPTAFAHLLRALDRHLRARAKSRWPATRPAWRCSSPSCARRCGRGRARRRPRRGGDGRPAAPGPHRGGRTRCGVRLRALRVPAPGHRAGRAPRAADG